MSNTIKKLKKGKEALIAVLKDTIKIISEEDIRKRAFEIYKENGSSSFNDKDNWYYAERELRGYYK